MGWSVSTFDDKYQIKYGSNTNYLVNDTDISYLTMTNTKHIGINNSAPSSNYLLDINGETHINSNLYITGNLYVSNSEYINSNLFITKDVRVGDILFTSNIIGFGGGGSSGSNNIKINYTTPIFSNNSVQVYGNTSFIGRVNIENQTSNAFHLLDINGSLKAVRIFGEGCNIFNINASNVRNGILETPFGGTGLSKIDANALLLGGPNNSIIQNYELLRFDDNTMRAPSFAGKFSGDDINRGIVKVSRGGTGLTSVPSGYVPFGNDGTAAFLTTPDFLFDYTTRTLEINTLKLGNSNIYLTDANNVLRNFHYNDLGIYEATSNTLGLVLPSTRDFHTSNGFLSLKKDENAIWVVNEDTGGSNIYFPNDIRLARGLEDGSLCFAGINIRNPQFPLDVKGDINTSNGDFRIDGKDIKKVVIDYAISNLLIDDLSGITVAGMKLRVPANTLESTISNGDGIWRINTIENTSVEFGNLITTNKGYVNNLEINNTDGGTPLDNSKYIFNVLDIGRSMLKFSKTGNMLVGNNDTVDNLNIPPSQRLEIIGNIHATGYIRSYYSDDRLKTFTSNIANPLDIIDKLKGFHYVPNAKALELGFSFENEIGLSAQDVKRVVPEIVKIAPFDSMKDEVSGDLVSKSGEDYLTICYERLGAVFVEAIKELRQENRKLKDDMKAMKKELDNIKTLIYIQ